MAARALIGALLLLAGSAAGAPFQRGVALGLYSEDPHWSYAGLLREIRDLGASHVSLVVAYYQHDATSTDIGPHPRFTAPDEAVVTAIRQAHRLGLQVMLFPILRLSHPRTAGEWRGTLVPRDVDAWWHSYGRLLLHLSRLAARERVAVLSVGSELSTLDGDRGRWQALIRQVRAVFSGTLTYSGNWDHFEEVAIYDLVDLMGVCAYFALSKGEGRPEVEDLIAAWQGPRERMERLAARLGRPLLLTEVGYPSQAGAAARPWDERAQAPVDLEEQRRLYEAFRRVWLGVPHVSGAYFWNWFGWGGPASPAYTPRGKPAAREIQIFFHEIKKIDQMMPTLPQLPQKQLRSSRARLTRSPPL
ncbi:MAG: hypothetical protein RMK29_20740 [Myxococcales bacterium]|nr:hypothetical protein [Myxococcota bacterium]MDW8284140.1 hypothetical protein [Myxococcales bacterium]